MFTLKWPLLPAYAKLVYVPCRPHSLSGPFSIETADGWVERVERGYVDIVEDKICLIAELVGGDGTGRFRVRFQDGSEAWVYRSAAWKYVPDGSAPYTPADLVDLPVVAA
jgi:hypothetical protein